MRSIDERWRVGVYNIRGIDTRERGGESQNHPLSIIYKALTYRKYALLSSK
jgi:hypothetical protein